VAERVSEHIVASRPARLTAAALRLPRKFAAHWLLGTGGASSIFLALVVLALLRTASDRVALVLAAYAIGFGIVILLAALRFRLASRPRLARAAAHR
jgi:cytochrome c biogenesis protein CcdA